MPQYRLIYFNARGFAEPARMVFAQAGVEYEDVRFERDEWPTFKPKSPTGKAPMLEVDGVIYTESMAIARYLANQFGLSGKTPKDQLRADMICDTMLDIVKPLAVIATQENETKKAEDMKTFEEEQLPGMLQNLEKMLVANDGGDSYFVGDSVTWADFCFIHFVTAPMVMGLKMDWSKIPKLQALNDRVTRLPKIAEWIEKRPKTQF